MPLLVALVALHHTRRYPLLDWAQTEIRIRDITGGHPPLIGLAGRIGPFGEGGGSHPGPISFYLLWPAWELFGARAYGMYPGNVALDVVAIALSMWIAYRRGGLGSRSRSHLFSRCSCGRTARSCSRCRGTASAGVVVVRRPVVRMVVAG